MDGPANAAQAEHWNSAAGRTWVELQPLLDQVFGALLPMLTEPLAGGRVRSLLDVGCGAGALTLAAAQRIGPDARCTGIDISSPLVAAAEARARASGSAGATFRVADAQTAAFEAAGFDAVLSRFGVMFFDDPVAAFANLHRATRPGGLLRFAAWRAPRDNSFMATPKRAFGHLVAFPDYEPDAPGQFGFADGERVRRLLGSAGWRDVAAEPIDVRCSLPRRDLPTFATRMGPLGAQWPDLAPETRSAIESALGEAYRSFEQGDAIVFTAACWLVTAEA